jgi:hypothetical protein
MATFIMALSSQIPMNDLLAVENGYKQAGVTKRHYTRLLILPYCYTEYYFFLAAST